MRSSRRRGRARAIDAAALDGVTALVAAGMTGYRDDRIHLSVVHSHTVKRLPGVRVHKITRRHERELEPHGIPRVRPAVAAIRAAHCADSDRQAALLLVLPTQQGLVRAADLLETARTIRGRKRRAFVGGVINDIALGVQSLGELDFARLCRARGLPERDRQVVRRGPKGRIYLDPRPRRPAAERRDALARHRAAHPHRRTASAGGRLHGPGGTGTAATRRFEVMPSTNRRRVHLKPGRVAAHPKVEW